ncbi:MAG: hypothetical protein JWQ16_2324 [Novosphingobium sp.]|nr:hypothetical protein [Novosphingobium sp.]
MEAAALSFTISDLSLGPNYRSGSIEMRILSVFAIAALAVTSAAGAATPAPTQNAGSWRVNGLISGRAFVLDCRLQQTGGVCVDADRKSQPLTSVSASGDQVAWSFKTRAMLMSVTLTFAGRITGNTMSGTMHAAGRTGQFTGVRR